MNKANSFYINTGGQKLDSITDISIREVKMKTNQAVNKLRRKEKAEMQVRGFKTKKAYRKWQKRLRAAQKELENYGLFEDTTKNILINNVGFDTNMEGWDVIKEVK